MKIYTKTGDAGETGLYGGQRVSKGSLRVSTYGTIDECNAILGMAIIEIGDDELASVVLRLQNELLHAGADLATPIASGDVVPRVTKDMTARLEAEIDRFESELEPLRNFILPGGSRGGALIHQARAVCRRAERLLVTLGESEPINPEALIYVNRLSDHLFVLARTINHRAGASEHIWRRPAAEHIERIKETHLMPSTTVGAPAPEFRLTASTRQGEKEISLSDYRGKTVVLYFYPKDDTPGCTTEACSFRDMLPDFEAVNAVILGISPDDAKSHADFAAKHALPFPLLADPGHVISEVYGVWKEKSNYGKTYMGIDRTTVVIDKDGLVAKIYPRVKVYQHSEKVLEYVKSLTS